MTLGCGTPDRSAAGFPGDSAGVHVPADVLGRILDRLEDRLTDDQTEQFAADLADLRRWLESEPIIEQAKGILMARYLIDADTAFQVLRRWSNHHNLKVRAISQQLTTAAGRGQDDPSGSDPTPLEDLLSRLDGPAIGPD